MENEPNIVINERPHLEALLAFKDVKNAVNVAPVGAFQGFNLGMFQPKIEFPPAIAGVTQVTFYPSDALRDFLSAAKAL